MLGNVGDLYTVRSRKSQDCVDISAVNLILGCMLLRPPRNLWKSSSEYGQIINTSSMYLFQRHGCLGYSERNFSSSSPM